MLPTSRVSTVLVLVLVSLSFTLPSCGGSGGGGGVTASGLTVVFPPDNSATRQSNIRVCGTTGGGVEAVLVNGLAASSTDGFLTWHRDLSLNEGANEVEVAVTAAGSTTVERRIHIRSSAALPSRTVDATRGVDGSLLYLAVDPGGAGNVLARVRPDGTVDQLPTSSLVHSSLTLPTNVVALDAQRNRAYVLQQNQLQVFDLVTMTHLKTLFAPNTPSDIVVNTINGHLLLATNNPAFTIASFLLSIDPVGQAVSVVSDSNVPGNGNPRLTRICHDSFNDIVYAWDQVQEALIEIDVATGARSTLSTTLPISSPVVDIAMRGGSGFIEVLTSSGERVQVSTFDGSTTVLPLPLLPTPIDDAPATDVNAAATYRNIENFGADSTFIARSDRLLRVYPDGNFEELAKFGRGEHPSLHRQALKHMAWDSTRRRLVVTNDDELLTLDLRTGTLTPLPGPVAGHEPFIRPIRYDASRDLLYYITAPGIPAPGAVVTMPATGGETSVAVPLPLGYAAMDSSYDPLAQEYLTAIQFPAGTQLKLTLRRSALDGTTIVEHQKNDDPLLDAMLFSCDAASNLFLGRSRLRGDIFELEPPAMQPRSIATLLNVPDVQTSTAHYDHARREHVIAEDDRLIIVDRETLEMRERFLPVPVPDGISSLTRDPATGLIYLGVSNAAWVLVVEPESLDWAYVYY